MIVPILGQFDLDNNVAVPSGKHSLASAECDRDAIVSELIKYGVFESCKDRYLTGVPKAKKGINISTVNTQVIINVSLSQHLYSTKSNKLHEATFGTNI